jgi:DNA-binding MurR/RpiR family transcriptional regulator
MKDCIIKINESLDSLPRREKILASYILSNLKDVSKMTITVLSKKSKTSAATIVRFANRLGYTGYRDFTKSLFSDVENGATYPENIMDLENIDESDTSMAATISRVSNGNIEAIQKSMKILEPTAIEKACNFIDKAGKVYLYAIGGSAIAIRDAVFKFQRLGIECQAFDNAHDQILSASILRTGDVAFYVSYSGESKELLKSLKIAKENKATSIALTKFGENSISKLADLNIHHASVAEGVRTNSTKSRIAQLNVIDIIFARLAEQRLDSLKRFYNLTNDVFLRDKDLIKK